MATIAENGKVIGSIVALIVAAIGISAILLVATVAPAIVNLQFRIGNIGNISTMEGLSVSISSINWGTVDPGGTVQRTLNITNTIDNSYVKLTFVTENWNPTNASSYLTLTWDYDETPLKGLEVRPITFNLTVAPSVWFDAFSFDIVVNGVYG